MSYPDQVLYHLKHSKNLKRLKNLEYSKRLGYLDFWLVYLTFHLLILISALHVSRSSSTTSTSGSALYDLCITVCNVLFFLFGYKNNSYYLVYFLNCLTLEFLYFKKVQIQIFKFKNLLKPISITKPLFTYTNIITPSRVI